METQTPHSIPQQLLQILTSLPAAQQQAVLDFAKFLAHQEQQASTRHEPNAWLEFAGMFKDDPLFDEFVEHMAAYRRELDAEVAKHEPQERSSA